jgi:propanediol dehydratase small subunit
MAAPPDLVTTPGGKPLTAITLEVVLSGEITADEIRISPRTLELQAQVAEAAGRAPLARALRRAAELTALPDDEIMATYEALRPRCETREGTPGPGRPPGAYLRGVPERRARPRCRSRLREARLAQGMNGIIDRCLTIRA